MSNRQSQGSFIEDYYETLQVSPNADFETIERVYRFLAKRYHPDNPQTGDAEEFKIAVEAVSVLSDPEKRAAYDVRYERARTRQWTIFVEMPLWGRGRQKDKRWCSFPALQCTQA